jgi:hypothetical protein
MVKKRLTPLINTSLKTQGVTVSMCAGGDIMDKTISEAAQILQRISNVQRTQRDWQRRCREEQNDKSKPKVLAEFSEKDEPQVKEDEPTIQEIEDPQPNLSME